MIDLEAMTPAERAHLFAALTEERDAARAELAQTKAQLDIANADFEAGADDYEIVTAERDRARGDLIHAEARDEAEITALRAEIAALARMVARHVTT